MIPGDGKHREAVVRNLRDIVRHLPRFLNARMRERKPVNVLEIGAGRNLTYTEMILALLHRPHVSPTHLWAVDPDITQESHEVGERVHRIESLVHGSHVHLVQAPWTDHGELDAIPLPGNFTIAVAIQVASCLDDREFESMLREVGKRMVDGGGLLLVHEPWDEITEDKNRGRYTMHPRLVTDHHRIALKTGFRFRWGSMTPAHFLERAESPGCQPDDHWMAGFLYTRPDSGVAMG
jgi:hypothetical protein